MNDMGDKLLLFGFSVFGFCRFKKMFMMFIDNYYGDFFGGNYMCRYIGFMGIKKGCKKFCIWVMGNYFVIVGDILVDMNSLVDIYIWFKNVDILSIFMF